MQAPRSDSFGPEPHVLLVGATARAAAQSLRCSGLAVTALDRFGDADLLGSGARWLPLGDPCRLPARLQRLPSGPLIPLGGSEAWSEALQEIARHRPVAALTGAAARRVRQPSFLKQLTRGTAIEFPPSRFTPPACSGGWLQKNRWSSGGVAVRRLEDPTAPGGQRPRWLPGAYWQRELSGTAVGVAYLADAEGLTLLGCCRALPPVGGVFRQRGAGQRGARGAEGPRRGDRFVYAGSIGPLALPEPLERQTTALAQRLVAEVGLRGLFNLDLLLDRQGTLWLLEVNARYTAAMELLDPGGQDSLLRRHLRAWGMAAWGGMEEPSPGRFRASVAMEKEHGCRRPIFGKQILFAPAPRIWRSGFEAELRREGRLGEQVTLHDLPQSGSTVAAGEPLLTIRSAAMTAAAALRAARRAGRLITQRLWGAQ